MAQTTWAIDPAHSELSFKVKHLMISNVKGEFKSFAGEALSNGTEFVAESINVTLQANSIFTNSDDRDAHLRSADFFDVENNKELLFAGKYITKIDDETFKLTGNLTMKGVSKEVVLDVEFGGVNKDPWGNEKAGFSVSTKINRKDWGLTWNAALEAGGVLVGEEIKISGEIQFVKQV